MELFTYKGISAGKYVEGELEALNLDEASHVLKEKKIIITYLIKSKKKKEIVCNAIELILRKLETDNIMYHINYDYYELSK